MGRYTHTTEIEFRNRAVEVEFQFWIDWGSPAKGHFGPPEKYDEGSRPTVLGIVLTAVNGVPGGWLFGEVVIEIEAEIRKLDLIGIADQQEAA